MKTILILPNLLRVSLNAVIVAAAALSAAGQVPMYTAVEINPMIVPKAINASGQIAGDIDVGGHVHAALLSGGVITDLGVLPGGDSSQATGINSSGQIVGNSTVAGGLTHGFIWSNGVMTDLGTLPRGAQSRANAINDAGQVTGYSDTLEPGMTFPRPDHAFLWSAGSMTDLGNLGTQFGNFSVGSAINSSGEVVGWSNTDNGLTHAVKFAGGARTDLGTLGGTESRATGINDTGVVTGFSLTTGDAAFHAFRHAGAIADMGTLSGFNASSARAINAGGQIVGTSVFSGTPGFIYTQSTGMVRLETRVTGDTYFLNAATAINGAGQIIASGSNSVVFGTYFLLTPVGGTPTPTNTPSATPTNTPTSSPTSTPTVTPTNTPTVTPTNTPTVSPTNTPTITPTTTPTFTPTVPPSSTPTFTPTATPSSSPTLTPTATATGTATATPSPAGSPFTVLHQFDLFDEGWQPYNTEALTVNGARLFGTASQGGTNGKGVIFSMDLDGSGYTVIHTFSNLDAGGFNSDGALPETTLTAANGKLYGTTTAGGAFGNGTVYSLDLDGGNFTTLLSLTGVLPNMSLGLHSPEGELTIDGNTLYGITRGGGGPENVPSTLGRIYTANTTGGGTTIFNFVQPSVQGYDPHRGLVLYDGRLYGFAGAGGPNQSRGTLFSLKTDGSDYTVLHQFTSSEGFPVGRLIRSGNILFGSTQNGGTNNGIIFSVDISGAAFTPLHIFPSSGFEMGTFGMVLDGEILYGSTQTGGNGFGSLFSMQTDGSDYRTLWAFRPQDGSFPGRVVLSNGYLYGATAIGGALNHGTVFRFSLMPSRKTLFDYDADGKTDISVFRPSHGAWYLQRSTAGLVGAEFGFNTDKLAPADYNGDGKTEIAVYRPETGIWYVFDIENGTTSYYVFGLAEDLPVPADYDGDGKADVAVFRPSTGTWYRQNSSDGSFCAQQFGATGDKPVLGDYDGDGKADLSVFRPSTGAWYQIYSSDVSLHGEAFGFDSDITVQADYDGDGKTDIAVYRPSNGFWYIRNSNGPVYTAFPFGLSDDIPAPGDFDGDGRSDLSVFRPSDGNWYRMNSSNGSFEAYPFGQAGDRPTMTAFRY